MLRVTGCVPSESLYLGGRFMDLAADVLKQTRTSHAAVLRHASQVCRPGCSHSKAAADAAMGHVACSLVAFEAYASCIAAGGAAALTPAFCSVLDLVMLHEAVNADDERLLTRARLACELAAVEDTFESTRAQGV